MLALAKFDRVEVAVASMLFALGFAFTATAHADETTREAKSPCALHPAGEPETPPPATEDETQPATLPATLPASAPATEPAPSRATATSGSSDEKEVSRPARYHVNRQKIYYGDTRKFTRPAVLEAAKIYDTIPAYRKIVNRKLTSDDPEYWPLMRRAAGAFVRGMKAVCARRGYDLVGELGSIKPTAKRDTVPAITDDVIDAVRAEQIVRERIVRGRAAGATDDAELEAELDALLSELVNFPEL